MIKRTLLTLLILKLLSSGQGSNQHRSILLSDVQTLTLEKGLKTQARRVSAIPQLKCIGGSAKCAFQPDVVQCYNRGSNGMDIQWECTAEMPKKYKFGKLSVSCEGYNYPEDPYILAGSCGLEYNLELTDKSFHSSDRSYYDKSSTGSNFFSFLFKVGVVVAIFFLIKSFLSSNRPGGPNNMSAGPDTRPPGGGGGGWFSNLFPGGPGGAGGPRRSPPSPGFRTEYTDTAHGYDSADCHANQRNTNQAGTGAGNFFTGAALGALGGYLFGARNRRPATGYGSYTGTTGGSGGWTTTGNSGSYSSSSGTHTTTGFASTTRR